MPLDQMVRFWKGKEETGQNTSIEFVETLKVNIEMVREMAYINEMNRKITSILGSGVSTSWWSE